MIYWLFTEGRAILGGTHQLLSLERLSFISLREKVDYTIEES